jgi:hypothetical protein
MNNRLSKYRKVENKEFKEKWMEELAKDQARADDDGFAKPRKIRKNRLTDKYEL